MKLKLSDFKDYFLPVKQVRHILSCCHSNKLTNGTLQNLAPKKSEKSAICKDIELKFGIKFGPPSSKTNINLGNFINKKNLTNFKIEIKR